ncbi:Dimer-Tnp-hAT domain containing protein, partial [Pyrenophora tritici-repentis]
PEWLTSANAGFLQLWQSYKPQRTRPLSQTTAKPRHRGIDDVIGALVRRNKAQVEAAHDDEYERWRTQEPEWTSEQYLSDGHPVKYWIQLRSKYPCLSQFAIDILTIPASSCDCERLFSELGDLLEPRRRALGSELLAALQLVRSWRRAGFDGLYNNGDDEDKWSDVKDEEIVQQYDIEGWTLIDIEDLLSPLQKQTYEENNSLTQNDRNDAETATEKDIQFELGNLDKEFDNSATPESTIRVRHPDDSPTTPESMVSRRQNVPGGWGDQYQDYVPDRYQNNAPRRLNPEVGSQENVIEGHRRRHRANYSDHNHLSTNMTYYSTFLAAISQPETTKLFGELPKVRLYRDQLPPPPKRYRDVATHPFANEFQKAMNVEFDN